MARPGCARQIKAMLTFLRITIMEAIKRSVKLTGLTPIMFDRYSGDNSIALSVEQKMYYASDGKTLIMPATNIASFLGPEKNGAPKRLYKSTEYKDISAKLLAYTTITPSEVPFMRNGEPIQFGSFDDNGVDKSSGVYVRKDVARVKDNTPNPKTRPVLPAPWSLEFVLGIYIVKGISESIVMDVFDRGGLSVGLGTFRRVFGKFEIEKWEPLKV